MKGLFAVISILVSSISCVYSQEHKTFIRKINLGITGGPNFSSKMSNLSHTRIGFNAGLMIRSEVSKKMFILSGLSVTQNVTASIVAMDLPIGTYGPYKFVERNLSAGLPLSVNYVVRNVRSKKFFGGVNFEPRYNMSSSGDFYLAGSNSTSFSDQPLSRYKWNAVGGIQFGYLYHRYARDKVMLTARMQQSLFRNVQAKGFPPHGPPPAPNVIVYYLPDPQYKLTSLTIAFTYFF